MLYVSETWPGLRDVRSQAFDADGAGLEFVLQTDQAVVQKRNPFLSRAEMRRIMAEVWICIKKTRREAPKARDCA